MHISGAQCRAARALLGWSRGTLAEAAQVGRRTVVDFERGARSPHPSTRLAIRLAFEAAGVAFVEENGGGAGVRFRDRSGPENEEGDGDTDEGEDEEA